MADAKSGPAGKYTPERNMACAAERKICRVEFDPCVAVVTPEQAR